MRGLPRWVVAPALLGALFIVVPVVAMVARLDLSDDATGQSGLARLWSLLTSPSAAAALGLSLRTSLAATALCVLLGVPMALVLARTTFPGQRLVRSLVLLPLVLPPVVGGLALLYTFGRRGLIGERLEMVGVEVAFTTVAVVMAQTFVALPFLVLSVEGALRTQDTRYEDVAATLGARPTTVLRRVTLPRVLPGLASGAVLAFARALGEFGATITFAGALQGVTQTLPLEIYLQRSVDPDAAIALSLLLVVVAVLITAGVHGGRPARGAASARRPEEPAPEPDDAHGPATQREGRAGDVRPDARHARPGPTAPVAVRLRVQVPGRGVDVSLDVAPGEVVAVLGPNGAGKSTLLQAAAGVLPRSRHDAVALTIDGADAPAAPHRRRVAWLSQRPLLLEHLRVLDDVAFGPRARGAGRRGARATARTALEALGAAHLAARRPGELSGGQAQRVAIARALATDPQVVLLDEPFASLDVAVAQSVRATLHAQQAAAPRTTILVTHDLLDVLLLADRAVVLDQGRVVEDAPARELLTRPRSAFAAQLAGVNLVTGTATSPTAVSWADPSGHTVTGTGELTTGAPAVAVFSPAAVAVHRERPHGSPRNVLRVRVTALEPHLSLVRVRAAVQQPAVTMSDAAAALPARPDLAPGLSPAADLTHAAGLALAADLTPAAVAELGLAPGDDVWFAVKAAEVQVYPA